MHAVNARVCYNGPVMQGLRAIKARACDGFYNSKALHYRTIVTNKGICSILYGKSRDLIFL